MATFVLIELSKVSKRFGSVKALSDLNGTIDGNVIGLLGPNGAGKSTLLKCLLGLTPHEGNATVLGLSTQGEAFKVRDRVGYMPEIDSYIEGLTAVEMCTFAAELSGLPKSEAVQRAHASLYFAGLEEKRYLKIDGYSTGMKQRVKLAQALVHDPELLFLDEPTNGLDPKARDEMLQLIVSLPEKRGCKIILSTHLLPDVDRICDEVVIMHQGALRFNGAIQDLRAVDLDQGERFVVETKRAPETLHQHLLEQGCNSVMIERGLCVTLPPGESTLLLFRAAKASQVQIRHLAPAKDSLESAFLKQIGEA